MDLLYLDPDTNVAHKVGVHNFGRDKTKVRVMGNVTLNPSDRNYPDKKWINISDLYQKSSFTEEYIKNNSF